MMVLKIKGEKICYCNPCYDCRYSQKRILLFYYNPLFCGVVSCDCTYNIQDYKYDDKYKIGKCETRHLKASYYVTPILHACPFPFVAAGIRVK